MATFSMGSQTGVSLYAPSAAGGLASLRGTDGLSSGSGVAPSYSALVTVHPAALAASWACGNARPTGNRPRNISSNQRGTVPVAS